MGPVKGPRRRREAEHKRSTEPDPDQSRTEIQAVELKREEAPRCLCRHRKPSPQSNSKGPNSQNHREKEERLGRSCALISDPTTKPSLGQGGAGTAGQRPAGQHRAQACTRWDDSWQGRQDRPTGKGRVQHAGRPRPEEWGWACILCRSQKLPRKSRAPKPYRLGRKHGEISPTGMWP